MTVENDCEDVVMSAHGAGCGFEWVRRRGGGLGGGGAALSAGGAAA